MSNERIMQLKTKVVFWRPAGWATCTHMYASSAQHPQSQEPFILSLSLSLGHMVTKIYPTKLHLLTNDSSSHLKKQRPCNVFLYVTNRQLGLLQNLS